MFDVILSPEASEFYEDADRPLARKSLGGVSRSWKSARIVTATSSACVAKWLGCFDTALGTGASCIELTTHRRACWYC